MRNFIQCPKCHHYHWDNEECAPLFLVFFDEYTGDEPMEIHAYTFEDAASLFAEDYNTQNDYCLMDDEIEIRIEKDGVVKHFIVGAEPDVHYSTKEIKPTNE